MSTKTVLFVTRDTLDGREGFLQALRMASGMQARVLLSVVGGRHDLREAEELLRLAAFAEAGYFPGLRERLVREARAASEQAAELRTWFHREAAVGGVELEISDGIADAATAVSAAMASTPDVRQVLFGPAILRDKGLDIRRLASRIERTVVVLTDLSRATT